jgi:hypothetical protein
MYICRPVKGSTTSPCDLIALTDNFYFNLDVLHVVVLDRLLSQDF